MPEPIIDTGTPVAQLAPPTDSSAPSPSAPSASPIAGLVDGGRPVALHEPDNAHVTDLTTPPEPSADGDDMTAFEDAVQKKFPTVPASPKATPAPAKAQEPAPTAKPAEPVKPAAPQTEPPKKPDEPNKFKVDLSKTPFAKHIKPAEPAPSQQQQPNPAAPEKIVKNYDGLPDNMVKAFKNMSNEAYAEVRPIYDELQKLKNAPPPEPAKPHIDTYLQDEQAFVLLPEFKQAVGESDRLGWEIQYWQEQLAKVAAGENWTPLVRYDQKTNKYYPGQEQQANAQAQAYLITRLQQAQQTKSETDRDINQIQHLHKQLHTQAVGQLRTLEQQLFPHYADANNPHKELIQQAADALPKVFRSLPTTPLIAKGYATIIAMSQENEELKTELASLRQQAAKQEIAKAGPTQGASSASSAINVDTTGDEDEKLMSRFKELTKGY